MIRETLNANLCDVKDDVRNINSTEVKDVFKSLFAVRVSQLVKQFSSNLNDDYEFLCI